MRGNAEVIWSRAALGATYGLLIGVAAASRSERLPSSPLSARLLSFSLLPRKAPGGLPSGTFPRAMLNAAMASEKVDPPLELEPSFSTRHSAMLG